MCLTDAGSGPLYAKMLMSSNHDAGRGSVIIPIVTTMGANPQSRAVRVFWKMKSMSNRRSPMAGSDARLRTPEAFLLLGTGIIFVYYFGVGLENGSLTLGLKISNHAAINEMQRMFGTAAEVTLAL